ncbi:hypothetical protein GWK47_017629 [Chionoecetes opilio]|uniref:Uncharacterized protein n=1 Tax=Chionoecetes opilio TaxID=41210 RepID=A0A8J4XVQ4_CHIOP|nr:hypothetical protein GWK47_017629 [Chionoecetes opilio]
MFGDFLRRVRDPLDADGLMRLYKAQVRAVRSTVLFTWMSRAQCPLSLLDKMQRGCERLTPNRRQNPRGNRPREQWRSSSDAKTQNISCSSNTSKKQQTPKIQQGSGGMTPLPALQPGAPEASGPPSLHKGPGGNIFPPCGFRGPVEDVRARTGRSVR